jgi:hypothetical protein
MAKNAKAANDDAAEPPWHLPWDIEEIRQHNPRLDDEQAHRAFLPSAPQLDARQWDTLVDSLTKTTTTTVSGKPLSLPSCFTRRSLVRFSPQFLSIKIFA